MNSLSFVLTLVYWKRLQVFYYGHESDYVKFYNVKKLNTRAIAMYYWIIYLSVKMVSCG